MAPEEAVPALMAGRAGYLSRAGNLSFSAPAVSVLEVPEPTSWRSASGRAGLRESPPPLPPPFHGSGAMTGVGVPSGRRPESFSGMDLQGPAAR